MGSRNPIFRYLVPLLVVCSAGLVEATERVAQKIVTSIKPLGLITEAIIEGSTVEVEVLLPPTSSPHSYALKLSDVKRMQSSDLVIWMGEEAEPYVKPDTLKSHLPLLSHVTQDRLIEGADKHDDHHHTAVDPHIWLDPVLAREIASLIAERLIALYPDQKGLIKKNARIFNEKIANTDQKLNKLFEAHRETGFLVYHDAYGYFVRRYNLRQSGIVHEQVGGGMSVKHLIELQNTIGQGEAICLFREPQFIRAALPDFGEDYKIREGILDPLGIEAATYQELIENLANQLAICLDEGIAKKKPG